MQHLALNKQTPATLNSKFSFSTAHIDQMYESNEDSSAQRVNNNNYLFSRAKQQNESQHQATMTVPQLNASQSTKQNMSGIRF